MDHELQAQAKQQQQPVGAAGAAASKADNAGVGRRNEPERVLIGHSMGGAAQHSTRFTAGGHTAPPRHTGSSL